MKINCLIEINFFSSLKDYGKEYERALNVWKVSKKNLGQYHDLYLKTAMRYF